MKIDSPYAKKRYFTRILFKCVFCLFFLFFSFFTCKAVKNGKYMSGSSYLPPPTSVRSINCLPSKAEKKYAYNDSVTT